MAVLSRKYPHRCHFSLTCGYSVNTHTARGRCRLLEGRGLELKKLILEVSKYLTQHYVVAKNLGGELEPPSPLDSSMHFHVERTRSSKVHYWCKNQNSIPEFCK